MQITELVAELALQIGVIIFAVRLFGHLAKKLRLPSVLGELLAGVVIGPYALGGIALPFFPHGVFPISTTSGLAVSVELYSFATVASIVLLFVTGLETNLSLFLRYSVVGGIIGICGALLSFTVGTLCGVIFLNLSFYDPISLFLGVIATTTSVGITARTLSDKRKMDSPEGVTILTASVFDDVLWIVILAIVLGVVSIMSGATTGELSPIPILLLAARIFGIWLGVTALFLVCSKILAGFLKLFKDTLDFSVLALSLALMLAGILEKQGLALIIGAYIAGLSLSKTDIAAVIKERTHGLYEFFVPIFFAVMGMMVNIHEVIKPEVLFFGLLYTAAAICAKTLGGGIPALALGFNRIGALRIGMGMIPRGEGALISCGIGLAAGVIDNRLFAAAVFMIFLTIVFSPPLLGFVLKIQRQGTRKPVKNDDSVQETWDFESVEIADLVLSNLLRELRNGGFFVQTMNVDEGLSQAHKGDIALFLTEEKKSISIATSKTDMPLVKNEMYEVIIELSNVIDKLKFSADAAEMKKELFDIEARTTKDILALIDADQFIMDLKGGTKEEIIAELVDILAANDKLINKEQVIADVLEREDTMSTGMEHGVALPHAKTDGIAYNAVAIGVKREGIHFDSMDGELSRLFVLIVSPKKASGLHIQFLAAVGSLLSDEDMCEMVINAASPQDAVDLLRKKKNGA